MGVYQHKNSRYWQYDFQVAGVRYTGSTGCESKTAARGYERQKRNEIAGGVQRRPTITWDEAAGLYWQAVGKHERNHVTTEKQLEKLATHFGAKTLITDIDRAEIDRFIAKRRGEKARGKQTLVANATVNREVQLLKRVLNRVPEKYDRPTIAWRGVLLKEAQERVRELTVDEERRLFEALPADLANVAEFALMAGQRRSAIITLLWSKVDLQAGRAAVRTKGDRWHSFPLTPRMVALIANQPKIGPFVFTYECERSAPPRKDRTARVAGERYPFSRDGWRRKWATALTNAGIEDFRFHDLRHTAATRMLRASRNMKAVQNMLGHTAITTTARYAHAQEDDVRQALLEMESRNSPVGFPENAKKAVK